MYVHRGRARGKGVWTRRGDALLSEQYMKWSPFLYGTPGISVCGASQLLTCAGDNPG